LKPDPMRLVAWSAMDSDSHSGGEIVNIRIASINSRK
jgi:hypothetical protein